MNKLHATPETDRLRAALSVDQPSDSNSDQEDSSLHFYWYFAGKIAKNDWRHSIVGFSLRNTELHEIGIPIQIELASEGHEYVGPFFVGCDHGCYHGPGQHGMLDDHKPHESCYPDAEFTRSQVADLCREQIQRSFVVFAWIEDLTCFGTLAEIGYAHGIGKPVMIGMSRQFPDLWLARQMACYCTIKSSAELAFKDCLKHL